MRRAVLERDLARLQGLLTRGYHGDVLDARHMVAAILFALRLRPRPPPEDGQLSFALHICPLDLVVACPLGCAVPAALCVARQEQSEREIGTGPLEPRTSPSKRGRVPTFVTCRSEFCERGAMVRLLVAGDPGGGT